MKTYFIEGVFSFLHILPIATIIYAIVFILIWLIGKRKPAIKLIPRYIPEFLLICYSCAILSITGILNPANGIFPNFSVPHFQETFHIPFAEASFKMALLNFLLFVPLGFLLPLVLRFKKRRVFKTILIAAAFSVAIEIVQIFIGRFFEIDDIISNSLGAAAGTFLWQGIDWIKAKQVRKGIIGICMTLVISGLFIFGVYFMTGENGFLQNALQMYSELPSDTELDDNLDSIEISSGDNQTTISGNEFSEDIRLANIYSETAVEISNNISQYEYEQVENVNIPPNDTTISVYLLTPQTFTFYNNPNIVMSNAVSFTYDISDGTIWYTNDAGQIYKLTFVGKDYDYITNDNLLEKTTEILKEEQAR